ncbi:MAG: F0F1 ATP synthase subunit B [Patescibacteria group bacterium]
MELFENLGIDWRLILIQIVNFGILLYLLKRFLYKPVLGVLERRKKEVEDSLALAEQVKKEFHELQEQKNEELTKTKAEAQKILSVAQERAAQLAAQSEEETRRRSDEMVERARKVIHEEKEKIVSAAKAEVVDVVMAAAKAVLGKEVKGKESEEFIKRNLDKKV